MSVCVHHNHHHYHRHLILLCCTECSVNNCKKCHPRHPNRCLKCDSGFSLIAPNKCAQGSTDICSQLYYAFIFDSLVLFVRQMYRVVLFIAVQYEYCSITTWFSQTSLTFHTTLSLITKILNLCKILCTSNRVMAANVNINFVRRKYWWYW